jgi:aminopeptidase
MDPRIEKLADVMVNYSIKVKKGDLFKIEVPYQALDLAKAVYKKALENGAYPYVDFYEEDFQELYFKYASDDQLKFVSPVRKMEIEKIDARFFVWGAKNTKFLTNTDPKRQAMAQAARKEISEIYFRRTASGEMRWCGTLFPNNAMAQDAGKSLTEFEDFVYAAGYCDTDDPISKWQQISAEQDKIVKALSPLKKIRVKSNDTDLRLNVEGRKWINCDGSENFPDGEIFTCPIENSANGVITYTYPAVYAGREVENVQLKFKDGVISDFSAGKNIDFLREMLNVDEGAKRIGEFAIGTNYNIQVFSKNTLFDEKIGGTCHIAVGNSLYEAGGVNKSAIHWDMVCELRNGGEIYGDDQLIYKDGKFVPGFVD